MIGRLRAEGLGIIYISHRMEEIFRLCDRVTVLRDGRYVATKPVAETDMRDLIGMMIGRDISDLFRKEPAPIGDTVLEVKDLSKRGLLRDISFSVRRGEIVGVAGLVGAGRTELARAIFGDLAIDSGEIRMDGKVVPPGTSPRRRDPGRHRPGAGGPQGAGPGDRAVGPPEHLHADAEGAFAAERAEPPPGAAAGRVLRQASSRSRRRASSRRRPS